MRSSFKVLILNFSILLVAPALFAEDTVVIGEPRQTHQKLIEEDFARVVPTLFYLLLEEEVFEYDEINYSLPRVTPQIAARFLTQATFGANENQIDALVASNDLEAWIDRQMALPMSRTLPYVEANSNGSLRTTRHHIWWDNVMQGEDQLRQRVAFALSQIFVISDRDYTLGNAQYGVSHYYDMLAENAFGNYRQLLEKITLHPTMGIYLGMVRNQKANAALKVRPDENYAREVLQLFSVGLYDLNNQGEALPLNNPTPAYSQETVEDFAKVFTGWNFADSLGIWVSNDLTRYDKRIPMRADYDTPDPNSYHDTSAKTLLRGTTLSSSANFARPAERDMTSALNNIANHPNVGPFISKLLIQRLTTSNPSAEYVGRVAAVFSNNGRRQRGDLGAVVKAILLDDEAIRGRAANSDFGKIKEPILQLSQLWRAFDAQKGTNAFLANFTDIFIYRLNAKSSDRLDEVFGQAILKSPSVFNFFFPNNLLSAANSPTLLAPEMQIMTEATIPTIHNALHSQVYIHNNQNLDGGNTATRINIDKAVQLASDPNQLIAYLNKILLAGSLPVTQQQIIADHLVGLDDETRAKDAIFLIIASSQFMIQQ